MSRRRGRQKGWLRREGDLWKLTYRKYAKTPDGEWSDSKVTEDIGPAQWTLKQATAAAKPILDAANRVAEKPSMRMTVQEFVEQYFPQRNSHHYRYLIRTFVLPELGLRQLCEVTALDCQGVIDRAARKYAPQTCRHIKAAIHAIYSRAEDLELWDRRNPAKKVHIPKAVSERRPTYTVEQLGRVLVMLKSPVYEMALLGAAVSLGPSELCGLRIKHANLTATPVVIDGEVLAPYSLAIREGWYDGRRTRLKTAARRRNLGITPDLAQALERVVAANKRQDGEAPLFQSRNGTPINTANIERRLFQPLSEQLGFPVTWYAFRRAHSTLAALVGADLQDRALVMGHGNDRMTRYYDIASVERMRALPIGILERVREQEEKAREEGKLVQMERKAG